MFGIPRLYVLVAMALACLVVGVAGAWRVQEWRYGAKENERLAAAARDLAKRQARADEAAERYEDAKAKEDARYVTVTRTVTKLVDRPVYRNICFDDDGRRLLNSYASGADPDSGQSAPTVPAPAKP